MLNANEARKMSIKSIKRNCDIATYMTKIESAVNLSCMKGRRFVSRLELGWFETLQDDSLTLIKYTLEELGYGNIRFSSLTNGIVFINFSW